MKNKIPEKPQNIFIFFSVILSLSFSAVVAEWVLRYQRQSIEQEIHSSERMNPGMILYDAELGWKLKPYWSGKHHHYDYDVTYHINRDGFRGAVTSIKNVEYTIIGDSFSFGLGVNDDETFTALLNAGGVNANGVDATGKLKNTFRNFSVPGYSTDQQLLLLNKLNDNISENIILVVYLGNDIFDNMRNYPLQAEHGKPFFEFSNNALSLKNVPVPHAAKSAAARKDSISSIVLGDDVRDDTFAGWLSRLEISRRLDLFHKETVLSSDSMQLRFSESLQLFTVLVDEIEKIIKKHNAQLSVVLLPGRSYVEQPESLSAQYQEFFRKEIKISLARDSIKVMDLASHLRALHNSGVENLYYPNEGHLTPSGHRYVANYLAAQINY